MNKAIKVSRCDVCGKMAREVDITLFPSMFFDQTFIVCPDRDCLEKLEKIKQIEFEGV